MSDSISEISGKLDDFASANQVETIENQIDGITGNIEAISSNYLKITDTIGVDNISAAISDANKVLKVDSEGNVSWQDDTDTTYTADGTTIALNGNQFSVAAGANGEVLKTIYK